MSNIQKPKISIFCAAIRTNLWEQLYNKTVSENKIPLEFVFVGHNKPNFKLPKNFKFIYSNVKPNQCMQIALMECSADLVVPSADDCFFSKNAFDLIYEKHNSNEDDKIIYGLSFRRDGVKYPEKGYYFNPTSLPEPAKGTPLIPLSMLIKKKDIMNLGGFDRNFVFGSLVDLYLRLMERGKVYEKMQDIYVEEVTINTFKKDRISKLVARIKNKYFNTSNIPKAGPHLYPTVGKKYDVPYLQSLWVGPFKDNMSRKDVYCTFDDLYISKKRLKPFEPFDLHNILTKSQGPTGGQWN